MTVMEEIVIEYNEIIDVQSKFYEDDATVPGHILLGLNITILDVKGVLNNISIVYKGIPSDK